ncbi:RING finger domain-containing protein [Endozoicomonas lisbonensis]
MNTPVQPVVEGFRLDSQACLKRGTGELIHSPVIKEHSYQEYKIVKEYPMLRPSEPDPMLRPSEPNPMCAICHENIPENQVDTLDCGHKFGKKCISRWVEKCLTNGPPPNCPMCRQPIKTSIHERTSMRFRCRKLLVNIAIATAIISLLAIGAYGQYIWSDFRFRNNLLTVDRVL